MIDLIFIVSTVVFFSLMLAYVRFCEALGQSASTTDVTGEPRQ